MDTLPAVGLALAGLYVLSQLTTFGATTQMNFIISSISVSSQGVTPVLNMILTAQNPTNSSLLISSFVATVSVNGTIVGNVAGFSPVTIAANSQTPIPLVVTMNGLTLFSDVVNILTGASPLSGVVTVIGTANINNLAVPLNITYNLL